MLHCVLYQLSDETFFRIEYYSGFPIMVPHGYDTLGILKESHVSRHPLLLLPFHHMVLQKYFRGRRNSKKKSESKNWTSMRPDSGISQQYTHFSNAILNLCYQSPFFCYFFLTGILLSSVHLAMATNSKEVSNIGAP